METLPSVASAVTRGPLPMMDSQWNHQGMAVLHHHMVAQTKMAILLLVAYFSKTPIFFSLLPSILFTSPGLSRLQGGCEVLATKAIRLLAVLLYVIKFEEQILYI